MIETSEILSKLIKNQKIDIIYDKKLAFTDLTRISNNIPIDIFSNECCIWTGYITNFKSNKKNYYISFFYKNKKVSLHRLLYANYIGNINNNEYIKYTCNNKGTCCTLNHMKKVIHETTNYKIKKFGKKSGNGCDDGDKNEDGDGDGDGIVNNDESENINKDGNNIRVSF